MADSTAEQEGQPAQPVQAVADPDKFTEYLIRCVPILLEDRVDASSALKAAIFDRVFAESIKKFLNDPQTPSLLIQRTSTKGIF